MGAVVSGVCTLAEQGPLCVAAFEAATPAGYDEAFSFNFSVDNNNSDMTNYDRKAGTFVLNIPKAYQMPGRTFAIIGVNESGLTKVFTDVDISDTTLTTVLDIEGYAFSLIYTDDPSARITGTAADMFFPDRSIILCSIVKPVLYWIRSVTNFRAERYQSPHGAMITATAVTVSSVRSHISTVCIRVPFRFADTIPE